MAEASVAAPMLADIGRQPELLQRFAAGRFIAAGYEHLRPGAGGAIWVAGCGDGLFAAHAASAVACAAGLDWRVAGALELLLRASALRSADRVVAVSMSGNVDRTVDAARAAAGARPLALVNGAGGRLAEIAAARVSLDLPEIAPFLCGTASYTATIAALMALAAGAAGLDEGRLERGFDAASRAQRAALDRRDLFTALPRIPSGVRILSAGADLGTAQYGAAKFVELTRIPVWWTELEEFAHSQYWSMPASDLVVVIAAEPTLAAQARDTCAALGELGVTTLAIDAEDAPVTSAAIRVTLPPMPPGFTPLATAVPLQLLAHALARQSGLDPDTRRHLKDDAARFRVSRLLTRRSLVGTGG